MEKDINKHKLATFIDVEVYERRVRRLRRAIEADYGM